MRTKPQTITSAAGAKTVIDAERICHREFLTPVRAFYLDLAQWAVDDPGRWGPWAAPCPVGRAETAQGKVQRHRKSRMDARTRERLPVLPVLVRSAARQHAAARALLHAARDTAPGDAINAPGTVLVRPAATAAARVWADDRASGKRRNLTAEEDRAFWVLGHRRGPARHRSPADRRGSTIEVRGTEGTMFLGWNGYEVIPEAVCEVDFPASTPLDRNVDEPWTNRRHTMIKASKAEGKDGTPLHARNFLDCVRSRKACHCDIEIGHRSTCATLIADLALKTKSYLEWDAKEEYFTNNPAANKYLRYEYRPPYRFPS